MVKKVSEESVDSDCQDMSNLPPNPYNIPGAPPTNANPRQPTFGNNPVPLSQLPPSYSGLKQDTNSNSPVHGVQNSVIQNVNHLNQSASSSPAFNHPGMMPPLHPGPQPSPVGPPLKSTMSPSPNIQQHFNSASPRTVSNVNQSPVPYNFLPQQRQINDNAPPLVPSSQSKQPLTNGPPLSSLGPVSQPQYPVSTSSFSPVGMMPPSTTAGLPPINPAYGPPLAKPPGPQGQINQPNVSLPNTQFSGPPRNSPLISGPPLNGPSSNTDQHVPPISGSLLGPRPTGVNGTNFGLQQGPPLPGNKFGSSGPASNFQSTPMAPVSGPPKGPPVSGAPFQSYLGPQRNGPSGPMSPPGPILPPNFSGPPNLPRNQPVGSQSLPPMGQMGPPSGPLGPPSGPMGPPKAPVGLLSGPMSPPTGPLGPPSGPMGLQSGPMGPPRSMPQSGPMVANVPQMPLGTSGHLNGPPGQPSNLPPAPVSLPPGPSMSNIQNRYPQMPQGNFVSQQPQSMGKQYAQYPNQGLTQQMGQLSVTKQGFDQLWGHHMVDLLQCRHILPEYPEDPPEIRLGHQFAESPNCSPDIFRCTINKIPDTNSLLQKSRLPLGILIHPFKDLNHLPVIQCSTIVRCRACRTYINPFVYFVDSKRWKCNLCYRVNDLPEEFQYDPVSKSYGEPSRRPEVRSATIEFIAPGEYMLRPPQPAVYLFLLDVSLIARESGYLQVVCETIKNNLDDLPGDARTQIGFICYDAHIHYYLMGEGLTRPKEMTVLDIDDVFLPSPESLVVNVGERRELIRELLGVLGTRHSAPAAPGSSACALGAALQAAYKLMAPTGGRITVFQTCLPNVGPGALQPREDPNARSSKDVAHLNPATDFYKRLALDCSGAQIAVDLFLLNSQYSDLATLSGMSKFSAGTVYHIPLFRASRSWQAQQLSRTLQRYLTRKIGFEAVMRVRCTRGISIHTFHGNFFVRSTDLLSLPNVSPDAGFGMQLSIDEALSDLQQVCFQAALLYTSSKGERRIRVHTLALPIASNLTDVLHAADQQCIIGLLSKMAVDRCASASMSEAKEALMNVAVDALSAYRLAQNLSAGAHSAALHAPASLRLLPLYLLALLKRKAFRTGTSTRLDDRVADMCDMKTLPLGALLRAVYPDLYPLHSLRDHVSAPQPGDDDCAAADPPRLHLSAERINATGAYLLDDGETMIIYICHAVSAAFLSDTFGVTAFSQLVDEARSLPKIDSEGNVLLHEFIDKLNEDRPYASNILVLKDNSPSRQVFTERLVDDRVESAFSYYEFLQHVKSQVK